MKYRDLPAGFLPHTGGKCPASAAGKRVEVILRSGAHAGKEPISAVTPPGWAADGANGCRWSHLPEGNAARCADIIGYRVL